MKTLVIVSTVPDERAEMTLKTANALGYHTVFAATSPMISSINGSAGRVSGDEHAVTRVSKLAGIFAEELLMSVKEKILPGRRSMQK